MGRIFLRIGLALVGYAVAVVIAWVYVDLRARRADPAIAAASGGMAAFGDALVFLGLTGALCLLVTWLVFFSPWAKRRPR